MRDDDGQLQAAELQRVCVGMGHDADVQGGLTLPSCALAREARVQVIGAADARRVCIARHQTEQTSESVNLCMSLSAGACVLMQCMSRTVCPMSLTLLQAAGPEQLHARHHDGVAHSLAQVAPAEAGAGVIER